jgi:hypothetical protein
MTPVQAELGLVLVQGEPEVALVQGEPGMALVQVESGMRVGPPVLAATVLVVLDQDAFVLVDKSDLVAVDYHTPALVVSGLDVVPGHHTGAPVDQTELGHIVYQADDVGGTENTNITQSVVLQHLFLWYVIKHYPGTQCALM